MLITVLRNRKFWNSYISTKRCITSVNTKIVNNAKEFFCNKLADNQASIILQFKTFLKARNPQGTIKSI